MTELVCKPVRAPVVKGRGLYEVHMNREPLGLTVRARNAGEADRMLQVVFRHELNGKTLDFDVGDFIGKENDNGKDADDGGDPEEKGQAG